MKNPLPSAQNRRRIFTDIPFFQDFTPMKHGFLSVVFLLLLLLMSVPQAKAAPTLSVTENDCDWSGGSCFQYGLLPASEHQKSYFKFDLSGVTDPIVSATFRVYIDSGFSTGSVNVTASSSADNWTQGGSSFPGAGTALGTEPAGPGNSDKYLEFDATSFVQGESSGDDIATFVISTDFGSWSGFHHSALANPPQLVLDTGVPGTPVAAFTASPTFGTAPLTVQFTDSSTDDGSIAARSWDFGDSSALDPTANPQHVFANSGVFPVTLTVTDDEGNASNTSLDITVNATGFLPGLTGQYFNYQTATPATALPQFVNPVATQRDANIDFDFGSGSPDGVSVGPDTFSICWRGKIRPEFTETYTFRTFSDDGVKLTINDIVVIDELQITPNVPHPRLHSGTINLQAGQLYDIQLAYFDGPQVASVKMQWESASRALEVVPSSRLLTDGTVGDCSDGVVVNQKPVASFTFTPNPIIADQAFSLNGAASSDADGSIATYAWTIEQVGGGTMQTLTSIVNPSSLLSAGNYTITLVVIDNEGLASDPLVKSVAIGVPAIPSVTVNATPTSGALPLPVSFTATASNFPPGATLTYVWNFDDGTPGETNATGSTQHTYSSVGDFNPTLTVTDDSSPANTKTATINVVIADDGSVNASFTIDTDPPIAGEAETIDASSSTTAAGSTITQYAWEIACDNGVSVQPFSGPGSSSVSLNRNINGNILNINGNAETFTIEVSPVGTQCDIQLTVTDDAGRQDVVTRNGVIFGFLNQAPVITSSSTASVEENTTTVISLTATDTEDDNATLTFALEPGADGDKFTIDATGALKFITAPDFETPTDTGGTDGDNVYEVNVKVSDSGGASATQTISVTVTNTGNEAPEITSGNGSPVDVSIAENTATTQAVATITATDPDTTDTLTFTLGGTDADAFDLTSDANGTTAVLTFKNAPDFDNPADAGADNVYDVIITVADNATPNASDTQTITVTVTDVGDNIAPEITSNNGDPVAVSVVENTPITTSVTTITATDADTGDFLSFALSGSDADAFNLILDATDTSGKTALLSFKNVPDFDTPTDANADGIYAVTVTVTDNAASSGSDSQAITVTVTDASDNIAPVITSNNGDPVTVDVAENSAITDVVATITAGDADTGDVLTFTLSGTDADDFDLNAAGATASLTFKNVPDFDNPTDADPDNVYNVIVTVSDDASPNASDSQTITVTVTDENDNEAPVANDDDYSLILIDGTAVTGNVLDNDTDPDAGDNLSVTSIAGTTAGGTVTEANGVFTYTAPAAGTPATDTFTYKANDGTVDSAASATVTLTLSDQPQQIVTLDCPDTARAGSEFTCQAVYTTSDGNAATTGLGFSLLFDSAELTWQSFDSVLSESFVQQSTAPIDEGGTNRSLLSSWTDTAENVNWPGQVPTTLFNVTFKMTDDAQVGSVATLSMSSGNPAANFGFTEATTSITVAPNFSWDVDGNGTAKFSSDGILIIRYLFGFSGDQLISNVIETGATRTRAAAIKSYLDANRALLDIDDNGVTKPLTDGLLIVRFLAGFTGDVLINNAVDAAGARTDAADIEAYLNLFKE